MRDIVAEGCDSVLFVADNSVVIAWFSRNQATPYTDRGYKRLENDEVVVPSVRGVSGTRGGSGSRAGNRLKPRASIGSPA